MSAIRRDDAQWVRGMFGLAPFSRGRRNLGLRQKTSAEYKFADTSLGGNGAINPPPQFTRFADIKATGLLANTKLRDPAMSTSAFENEDNSGSFRMGRFYSETIDDNSHHVHFRFGVPKYTGTIAFFANMYDRDLARLAKTGEYSTVMRTLGQATGLAVMFAVVPMAAFIPLIIAGQVLKFATKKKPSKYYYMKPTMNLYLQAVQSMLDTQLLHHRLVPMWDVMGTDRYTDATEDGSALQSTMDEVYSALPDIWKSSGKFDVYKMINRYQVLANYQARTLEEIYAKSANEEEYAENIAKYVDLAKNTSIMKDAISDQEMNLFDLSQAYASNPLYQINEADEAAEAEAWAAIQGKFNGEHGISGADVVAEQDQSALVNTGAGTVDPDQTNESFWGGFFSDVGEQLGSELKDGSQWVTFRVDSKATISDSFSNSTKEPEISSMLNGLSSKARSLEVSASGGKTGFDLVDSAISGVKDFMGGVLDTFHISGLAAIYGSSIVDIPEVWDSSSAQVGTESFTLQLRSPYGNDLSVFQNVIVPLCFLLTGALPLATGKQTHTSPFLCEVYSRGRQTVRLGIIDSISITRGTGNMGWRADGRMLGCDITVNIKDLSKVMHMPVLKDPGIFDDDNMYTDYMATIGGASLHEMIYSLDKVILNLNKWKQSWKSAFSSGRIANSAAHTGIARVFSAFTAGTTR